MKHIQPYLNESISRGAVVLITGKLVKGQRRLYATHVLGHHELRPGVVMLFLSDSFYRIKEVEGRLGLAAVSYRDEDSLKSTLNLKSPGKISIVRNANKTPFHWKTLKHNNILSAVRELEPELLGSEYLLESHLEEDPYSKVYSKIAQNTIESIFGNENTAKLIEFDNRESLYDLIESEADEDKTTFECEYSLTMIMLEKQLVAEMQELEISQPVEIVIFLDITVDITRSHDPGDDATAPSWNTDWNVLDISLTDHIYVDGEEVDVTEREKQMFNRVTKEFNDEDIIALFEKKKIKF